MHVYLRIFLACVPTQLVKPFGIKGLNIYCLVRTVWPLQRQRSAPGVGGREGGWVSRYGPFCHTTPAAFLSFFTLISALFSLCLQLVLFLSLSLPLYSGSAPHWDDARVKVRTEQSGVCLSEEDRTTVHLQYRTQVTGELQGCGPAQVKC